MSEPAGNKPARVPALPSLRLVQWVLEHLAGRAVADSFIGDLHEGYHAMVTRYGARRAQWWIWWQLLSALPVLRRVREPAAQRGQHLRLPLARRMQVVRRYVAVGLLVILAMVSLPWWRQGGSMARQPLPPVPLVSAPAQGDPHRTRTQVNPDPRMVRILPNPDPRMVRVLPNPEHPPDAALATLP